MADYDVIVIGAGPGGIFSAYELAKANRGLKVAVFELGRPLDKRRCPIDGKKIKSCVKCNICNIMSGFGGAGAFSDGKYNITNQFGGTLYEHVGKQEAIDLMMYVDEINRTHGGEGTKLYSTANTGIKRMCLENGLPRGGAPGRRRAPPRRVRHGARRARARQESDGRKDREARGCGRGGACRRQVCKGRRRGYREAVKRI